MQFSKKRVKKLLLSCKKSDSWTFEDLQTASVLITGRPFDENTLQQLSLDSTESLVDHFYLKQTTILENLVLVFNHLDNGISNLNNTR